MHNYMYAANHDMYQFTEFRWFNLIQAIFHIYIYPYKLGFSQLSARIPSCIIIHDI